jgi:hypothetical protein
MTKISALAFGALVALSTVALAHADSTVTGVWKLSVGVNDAPCTLTLTPDDQVATAGTVAPAADCESGLTTIGHWKAVGTSLQLYSPSGELVAWLKPKGDIYEGSRISDGRKLALAR